MDDNRKIVARVEMVLSPLQSFMLLYVYSLIELCSNNIVEYNALIISLQLVRRLNKNILKR